MMEGWNLDVQGGVAVLTIHRPQFLNALNTGVLEKLDGLLTEVEAKPEIRALIITGSGEKAFVAGADIDQLARCSPADAKYLIETGHKVFDRLERLRIPVIAAINGFALGGGLELALCADLRICSATAKFSLPEIKLGLIPGWGGPCRLARLIGAGRAKDMIYRARFVAAEEAWRYGLVTEVFPTVADLREGALKIAAEIAAKPPITMALDKEIINDAVLRGNGPNAMRDATSLAYCFTTEDSREGVAAFVAKRPPDFCGK